jgi:two-component system chemotaxis sensor kinase CheA
MNTLLDFLILPKHISDYERRYLARMNRIGLWFFALHIPAFASLAWLNGQSPLLAIALTSLVMAGPALAMRTLQNPRGVSLVYGFTAMLMGGLLVHFGQGPVQIEMHFYFFALLAMLVVYANPMAIVVAAVTVALHHLALWAYLPASVFNYAAPLWVVLVHAAFVVLESVASCFIARSFFDNVIGLEKIVQARTEQLDARNRDMRVVLDHVNQGFFTIDREMIMSGEKSRVVEQWFGACAPGQKFSSYIQASAPTFAPRFELAWDAVVEDIMPLALTIDQLPGDFVVGERHYELLCTPIMRGEALEKALVMISDITANVQRARLEADQRDVLSILGRLASDRVGVLEFFDEAQALIASINDPKTSNIALKRALHTLKGNAMIFGVQGIASQCHELESRLDGDADSLSKQDCALLDATWNRLCRGVDLLLGANRSGKLELEDAQYQAILHAVLRGEAHDRMAEMIGDWKLEPTERRLARIGEQAQGIAKRLNKGILKVEIEHQDLRLDPEDWGTFWSAFVHAVRNAVDHGIETSEEREKNGKAPHGTLELRTRAEHDAFVIEIADDGRGIDWGAVMGRARERGLPCATQAELTDALFADGVSTKTDATEYSGRGVGMGVLRAACVELGGELRVHSQQGQGTRFEFRFPLARMRAPVELRKAS